MNSGIFDPCSATLSHLQNLNHGVSAAASASKDKILLIPEEQYCMFFHVFGGLVWSVRAFSIRRQLERRRVNLLRVAQRQTDSWMLSYTYTELRPCIQTELHGHYSKWSQATLNKLVKWGLREGLQAELSPHRVFHRSPVRFSLLTLHSSPSLSHSFSPCHVPFPSHSPDPSFLLLLWLIFIPVFHCFSIHNIL